MMMLATSFVITWLLAGFYLFIFLRSGKHSFILHCYLCVFVHCESEKNCATFILFIFLCQMLTGIYNSFTGAFRRQLAIERLLYIPAHYNCVATLLCDM